MILILIKLEKAQKESAEDKKQVKVKKEQKKKRPISNQFERRSYFVVCDLLFSYR